MMSRGSFLVFPGLPGLVFCIFWRVFLLVLCFLCVFVFWSRFVLCLFDSSLVLCMYILAMACLRFVFVCFSFCFVLACCKSYALFMVLLSGACQFWLFFVVSGSLYRLHVFALLWWFLVLVLPGFLCFCFCLPGALLFMNPKKSRAFCSWILCGLLVFYCFFISSCIFWSSFCGFTISFLSFFNSFL